MKYILALFFMLFAFNVSAQNVFNPVTSGRFKIYHIINSIVYMRYVFSILISAKDRFFCV